MAYSLIFSALLVLSFFANLFSDHEIRYWVRLSPVVFIVYWIYSVYGIESIVFWGSCICMLLMFFMLWAEQKNKANREVNNKLIYNLNAELKEELASIRAEMLDIKCRLSE